MARCSNQTHQSGILQSEDRWSFKIEIYFSHFFYKRKTFVLPKCCCILKNRNDENRGDATAPQFGLMDWVRFVDGFKWLDCASLPNIEFHTQQTITVHNQIRKILLGCLCFEFRTSCVWLGYCSQNFLLITISSFSKAA